MVQLNLDDGRSGFPRERGPSRCRVQRYNFAHAMNSLSSFGPMQPCASQAMLHVFTAVHVHGCGESRRPFDVAQLILYPTAIGTEPQDANLNSFLHWCRVMMGHSGANLVRDQHRCRAALLSADLQGTFRLSWEEARMK